MRVSSSIRARAGSLPTSGGQAGPLPGGASDLGIPQNLGELRFPRLLSKRKSPHTYSHSGSPRVILKELAATWARHTSRRTLLHLESPLWAGIRLLGDRQSCLATSPVKGTESTGRLHMCTRSLTGQHRCACFMEREGLYLLPNCIDPLHTTGYISVNRVQEIRFKYLWVQL